MTDKERFHATMRFEPCDQVLQWEQGFWGGTIERWYREGLERRLGVEGDPAYGDTVRGPATPLMPGSRICHDICGAAELDSPSLGVPVELYLDPPFEEAVLEDRSCVKVVCAANGRALYFSRLPIPCYQQGSPSEFWNSIADTPYSDLASPWLLHMGLYAYRREFLLALTLTQPDVTTLPVLLNKFQSAVEGRLYGPQAAIGTVITLPVVIMGVLIQKHLVKGFTFGMIRK